MTEQSNGRIEVAPEVILTIARNATVETAGVAHVASTPSTFFRRGSTRQEGIVLQYEDSKLVFDIYVVVSADVNMRDCSLAIQKSVVEAIDNMVGLPIDAVNIHVENVIVNQNRTD